MGNGIFKTLVAIILLATVAFLCGSLAADGVKSAIVPILILAGSFFLLYMGKNCWWLVYLLLPLVTGTPTSGMRYIVVNCVLLAPVVYWFIMAILGRVRLTWYGVPSIDILVASLAGYMLVSWFRHPVYLNIMLNRLTADDSVLIGGADYVVCIFVVLTYIAISVIPVKFEQFVKALKFFTWMSLLVSFAYMVISLAFPGEAQMEPGMSEKTYDNSRVFEYLKFSSLMITLLLCKYSVWDILISPWKFLWAAIAGLGVMVAGFRSSMMYILVELLVTQWLHRRLMSALLLAFTCCISVVFLSQQNALDFLPYGIKRVFSPLPGIEFEDRRSMTDAQGSVDWRVKMWEWALDPSKGYIKDYVWGDGFGHRIDEIRRERYLFKEVSAGTEQQKKFARHGQWHNGPIAVMHRLGVVGLCIVVVWTLVVCVYVLRVLRALDQVKGREYVYFALISLIPGTVCFYGSAGTVTHILKMLYSVAILKVCYCHLRKLGYIQPFFEKREYVPLMIKELDDGTAVVRR